MKDSFLEFYGKMQEIWNEKKSLDYSNAGGKKRTIKKLQKFVDSLDEEKEKLQKEIDFQKELHNIT